MAWVLEHQHAGHDWTAREVVVEEILAQGHVLERLGRGADFPQRNPVDQEESHDCARRSRQVRYRATRPPSEIRVPRYPLEESMGSVVAHDLRPSCV
jgi:hypothetical protein